MGYIYYKSLTYNITLITIASILLITSLPTLLLNMCIVISILRKSELHTPSFIVIINLALSDCLSGCTVHISYAIICIRFASGYDACPVAYIGTPLSYVCVITSFYTITLQTVERYLAIFFPYWYHEKVTAKCISVAALSTWLPSIALVTYWMITEDNHIFHSIVGSLWVIFLFTTVICYVRIFCEVRRIEKDMMINQTASCDDRKKIKSESKVARATLTILVVVLTCYSPGICIHFYFALFRESPKPSSLGYYWVWLLTTLNSFLNPLIACRQLTVLRRPVKEILLAIFPCFKKHYVTPSTQH